MFNCKNLLIFFGIFCFQPSLTFSQTISSDFDTVVIHTEQTDLEAYQIIHISNNTADSLIIRWTRTVDSIQANWSTTICDNAVCYPTSTSTASFMLEPGLAGIIKLMLYPDNTAGFGELNMHIEAENRPDINSIDIPYYLYVNESTNSAAIINYTNSIKFQFNQGLATVNLPFDCRNVTYNITSIDGRILQSGSTNVNISNRLVNFTLNYLNMGIYVVYLEVETSSGLILNKAYKLHLMD